MGNQCCAQTPDKSVELDTYEAEAIIDIKSVRASELETPSTIASPRDETNNGRLVTKTSQPDDKALQERMALMDQIEANPEEADRFVRIVKPSSLHDGETEAMADMNQARADAHAELAF